MWVAADGVRSGEAVRFVSDGKRDDKDERHALSGGDPSQVVGACCSRLEPVLYYASLRSR